MNRTIIELSSPPHRSPYESFDERLRKVMDLRDMSSKQVYARIRMGASNFSRLHRGLTKPNFWTICELAKVLNVSLDYLAGFTDEPRPLHPEN